MTKFGQTVTVVLEERVATEVCRSAFRIGRGRDQKQTVKDSSKIGLGSSVMFYVIFLEFGLLEVDYSFWL